MKRLHRQPICVASALVVPFLAGVAPLVGHRWRWSRLGCALAVALGSRGWSGVGSVVGCGVGAGAGWSPSGRCQSGAGAAAAGLVVGTAGARAAPIQRSLNLGLLAWLGSMGLGLSLILQLWWRQGRSFGSPHPELGSADPLVSGPGHGFAGAGVGVVAVAALAQEGSLMRLTRRDLLLGAAAMGLGLAA